MARSIKASLHQDTRDGWSTDEERWPVSHAAMLTVGLSIVLWGLLIGGGSWLLGG